MGLTRQQEKAARMVAKGFTLAESARAVGYGSRTVERWNSPTKGNPEFRRRVEHLREENPEPGVDEILRSALSATMRDGSPNWNVILQACKILKLTPPDPAAAKANGSAIVHMNFFVDRDGNPTLRPDWIDADTIDAEPPGHGMLPPAPEPER